MSSFRSLLFLILISLSVGAGLLLLGSVLSDGGYRGGYAVLSTDASVDDRVLRELLEAGKNNFAGSPVSESSQWVMLDEFGSLEVVPLDVLSARLNSFDPRNDGYAGKLKNIFVRDGKRFVYIPLKTENWTQTYMDTRLKNLLGDVSFSVDYFSIGKPLQVFFLIYAAASLSLLVICYVKRNSHPGAADVIAMMPALSCLAFFGAAGIAAAALFFGFFILIREPSGELVKLLGSKESAQKQKLIQKEVIEPYRLYWFFIPVFAAALGIIVAFSQLKILFVLLVSVAACAVFFLSVRSSLFRGKRRRFTPVLIVRRLFPDFIFSVYMLPFAAAAFLIIFLAPYMSGAYVSNEKFDHVIDEQDYYAHLTYQASFSVRQLGASGAAYPGYVFDEDGLPSPDEKNSSYSSVKTDEFPPFPLKHLMDFFNSVNNGSKTSVAGNRGNASGILSLLILLAFILPGFFIRGRFGFPPEGHLSGLNRLSGKLRWTDINRKKVLLYNNRNALRIQRGAAHR